VTPGDEVELKWEEPKEDELKKFLVDRMGFNPERVQNGINKLQAAFRKKSQKRMDRYGNCYN
jgi:flap endonuclease-1